MAAEYKGSSRFRLNYDSVGGRPLSNLGINDYSICPSRTPNSYFKRKYPTYSHTLAPPLMHWRSPLLDVMQNFTGDLPFSGIIDYGSKNNFILQSLPRDPILSLVE